LPIVMQLLMGEQVGAATSVEISANLASAAVRPHILVVPRTSQT
jgi:hypothetical protein